MSDEGKSAGGGIVALGIILIIVGIVAHVYSEERSTYWGLSSETVYPYREIGTMLLFIGIIVAVIGGIVYGITSLGASSSPPPQPIIIQPSVRQPQQVILQPRQVAQSRYCGSCGRAIPLDSVLCPYCGHR